MGFHQAEHETRAKPLGTWSRSTVNRAGQSSPSFHQHWHHHSSSPAPNRATYQDKHEQKPHASEHPVTTTPESICRSRSASGIKMTLLTTTIISNDFSVYLHTLPSCIDVVFLKKRSQSQNTFQRTLIVHYEEKFTCWVVMKHIKSWVRIRHILQSKSLLYKLC